MSALVLAGGMALAQGGLQYLQAKEQFELIQRQNRQAREAGDRAQALTSVNINRAKDATLANTINIDVAGMQAKSAAIVSAAAAGTAGTSVDDSILDIERNAAKAEANELARLNDTIFSLEESRESIEAQVRSRSILQNRPNAAVFGLQSALNFAQQTHGTAWGL